MEIGSVNSKESSVTFGSWIRRPDKINWVVLAKSRIRSRNSSPSPAKLEIFSFDPETVSLSSSPLATYEFEESEGDPVTIAVHPSGDDVVCSTSSGGCKLLFLYGHETNLRLSANYIPPLQDVGEQKCLVFSVDGLKLAAGGTDGHLRILEWPSQRVILDEARAHRSFRDMDFSLDSAFLASTSTDGTARIWNMEDGAPLTTLTRNLDEKIELCRFSMDGTKPFLFCAVQKGNQAVTNVYDISTWNKIGHKKLLRKPASIMSVSLDGKYLALGSKDGDISVVEVKKMEISQYTKRLHLGTNIETLEFCPNQRVILTTSKEWGVMTTKLTVPADWKEWQIYVLLLGLFLASAVLFYVFFQNSDSFWKLPNARDQPISSKTSLLSDPQFSDDPFGPVDL
jgi:prolactin regulatory element-binding protein